MLSFLQQLEASGEGLGRQAVLDKELLPLQQRCMQSEEHLQGLREKVGPGAAHCCRVLH